jgi:hypothetical protein
VRGGRSLPNRLQTEREAGGNGLQIGTDKDTGESAVKNRGVEGLDRGGEVIAGIVDVRGEDRLSGSRAGAS